ncbi:MAG: MBL fold metallo-hydrolase [Actinobacteria bacterium]|nr:MBL fold metallo-hydrolase [Actinomycetota bacterium]
MDIELFLTPGLGDSSYLLASEGEAAAVDPQRDAGRMLAAAEARGVKVRYVLETHVHNDYVSGAAEVRAATGAEIVGPARGRYGFPFTPMEDASELEVGDLRLATMETPGHTPEHVSYLVYEEGADAPSGAFTGGSLIVGSAGRTDLLGPERADELARAQYRSLRRLATLPDRTPVLPTHGAGSFCASSAPHEERTSTIGRERAMNPALADVDEETFVREQLSGLLAFPAYYAHMAPINRAGPTVFGTVPQPPALSPDEFAGRLGGAWIVDGRNDREFAGAHLAGSLNIELDGSFASYVGWLVPFNDPVLLILPEPEPDALHEASTQLFRIGYERLEGYLEGGVEAWRSSGRDLRAYPVGDVDELLVALRGGSAEVLDVRQRAEWDAGHLEGSRHLFVGDLPGRFDELPTDREIWAVCGSGHRAGIAASLLDRAGRPVRLVAPGGVPKALRKPT